MICHDQLLNKYIECFISFSNKKKGQTSCFCSDWNELFFSNNKRTVFLLLYMHSMFYLYIH